MRILLPLLIVVASFQICIAQQIPAFRKIDTVVGFYGADRIISSDSYDEQTRIIPPESLRPLYVRINYLASIDPFLEYFRIDFSTYLYYQYYRNRRTNGRDGLRQQGTYKVTDRIVDFSVSYIDEPNGDQSKELYYFTALSKTGTWLELDDSGWYSSYWTGNYFNNQRTGKWRHLISSTGLDENDDFEIEYIDYSTDTSKRLREANISKTTPTTAIKDMLIGRWILTGCDAKKEPRMIYRKCVKYSGAYGDDCNNRWSKRNYYDFGSASKFVRQRGEGCHSFREGETEGDWRLIAEKGEWYLLVHFPDKTIWKLRIVYLDKDGNMVTDRL